MSERCPHCGELLDTMTAAQIALRNAVLTPEQDAAVRKYVDFLIWKRTHPKQRKRPDYET